MKKFILSMVLMLVSLLNVNATSYKEAENSSKPFVLFLYADWIDNKDAALKNFNNITTLDNRYNYVSLNIKDYDMKYFNQKYNLNKNLPYIMLINNKKKLSRILNKSCSSNSTCVKERLDLFIN